MKTTPAVRSAADREAIRQRFLLVDTSNVADVLDTLGLFNQGLSSVLTPYPASSGKLAGWAYTIRGQMSPYELGGDPDKMKACSGVSTGDVTVWSGDGEGICYFGELIAIGMKERGCVGSLVDGGIRDIRWIAEQDFPVFARYRCNPLRAGRSMAGKCPSACVEPRLSGSPCAPATSCSATKMAYWSFQTTWSIPCWLKRNA
jgi:4-hydroxy-4-methyl-2-oxoglutarate aldolase